MAFPCSAIRIAKRKPSCEKLIGPIVAMILPVEEIGSRIISRSIIVFRGSKRLNTVFHDIPEKNVAIKDAAKAITSVVKP